MEDRICFDVFLAKAGWSARFDGHGELHHFITRERALDAAREAAQMRWEILGKPSCVNIREIDGEVVTDVEFG